MAKDKNSFVAYTDWNTTFEKLSDEEAGRLAKMMFAFVSDQNPEAPDRMTELLFDPIKSQLKRDLKSYEKALDNNSRKGRMGNLKRWHSDLYSMVTFEKLTLEEAEEIAKGRTCDKNIATAKNLSQNIADNDNDNDTDTDTDTVNVNDTVTDILLEKETKDKNLEKELSDQKEEIPQSVKPETEEPKKVAQKKVAFKPPSVQEVQDYCNERQNGIQAFTFVNFYQSKGWKVGSQPMKDWKAAIHTWESKNKENGKPNYRNQTGTIQPVKAKRR